MSREKFDVIVVGAGPSGSIAAEMLANGGLDVLLCEKKSFPRYKCCAAGVLWHDIEDFPQIKPVIENYNYAMVMHPPSLSREFVIKSENSYLMGQTYRTTLDAHLARLAVKSGAELREHTRIDGLSLLPGKKGVVLEAMDTLSKEKYKIEAQVVIGADGVNSVVRRSHPGFSGWDRKDLLIASEIDVPIGEKKIVDIYGQERAVHVFLYFKDLPGYAWIFTKKKSVSIGMGTMLEFNGKVIGGRQLNENFRFYINFLKKQGYLPGDANISRPNYALIPSMPLHEFKPYSDNLVLVGDAAGIFVSPLSGEGIYYGMLSGRFAAQACLKAIRNNDLSVKSLSQYEKLYLKRLKHELNYQNFAKKYMLHVERRCEKAIRWAVHDKKIRNFMKVFFTGAFEIDRAFATRLIGHYIRLKVKDALGLMGPRERKKDYDL
ncbi:MAG: NAD(P)/FAD-dependent oxidoreductase [Promethearchaeota archaeon]